MATEDSWEPDDAMVFTVRTRTLPVADLSGPDRAWVIAALTTQGWTVNAIAERLACSLRLVQQIKTEPMTRVALYAMRLRRDLITERNVRRLEAHLHAQELAARDAAIARLTAHRDLLLDRVSSLRKGQHGCR